MLCADHTYRSDKSFSKKKFVSYQFIYSSVQIANVYHMNSNIIIRNQILITGENWPLIIQN